MGYFKVVYIGTSFKEKVLVSKYYHNNSDKTFRKTFSFWKTGAGFKEFVFSSNFVCLSKKNKLSIYDQDVQKEDFYFPDF